MSHGVAGMLTLYDDAGNPVSVKLVYGEYRLVTVDEQSHDKLDEIQLLLARIVDLLESRS